jgi:hypothetical protein
MRSVTWVRFISVPALLLAVVAVGCGGHQNAGQGPPGSPPGASDARISGESVVAGDRRVPGTGTTMTTARPGFTGIARTSSPVPPPELRTPVSRPRLPWAGTATTSGTTSVPGAMPKTATAAAPPPAVSDVRP